MTQAKQGPFEPNIFQATIFTPDQDHTTAKIMSEVYPRWAEIFNGEPQVIPANLPAFPAEAPRITLRNDKDTLRAEIAAVRLNLSTRILPGRDEESKFDGFFGLATDLLRQFMEITKCRVGRLAAVRSIFWRKENPGLFLARHFCKEKWDEAPLDRPENFELHSHKIYTLNDKFNVNSWARCKTGSLSNPDGSKKRIVVFEQDINTLHEDIDRARFEAENVTQFYSIVPTEFDSILDQYFPLATSGGAQ